MEESYGGKLNLRRIHEVNKIISWGRRIYFDNCLIVLWNFGEIFLVHYTVSVHSPFLWTNFEEVGFLSNLVDGEKIQIYNWSLMKEFLFSGLSSIHSHSHLSPHSLIPSSPFPHTLIWWRSCWSDSCALLRIVDGQDLIYDVWIYNIMS